MSLRQAGKIFEFVLAAVEAEGQLARGEAHLRCSSGAYWGSLRGSFAYGRIGTDVGSGVLLQEKETLMSCLLV